MSDTHHRQEPSRTERRRLGAKRPRQKDWPSQADPGDIPQNSGRWGGYVPHRLGENRCPPTSRDLKEQDNDDV